MFPIQASQMQNPLTITNEKQTSGIAAHLDRMVPLGKAASMIGVDSRTLRRWLEDERGLAFPRLGHGSSPLVRLSDVQAVIASHQGIQKYSPREARRTP